MIENSVKHVLLARGSGDVAQRCAGYIVFELLDSTSCGFLVQECEILFGKEEWQKRVRAFATKEAEDAQRRLKELEIP